MGRDLAELHLGHDGRSEGRRLSPSRRVSECDQQCARLGYAVARGVSVDAADVPLQRLVLPVVDRRARRHQRVPASCRGEGGAGCDPRQPRDAYVRRADRLLDADQCTGGTAPRHRPQDRRPDRRCRAAGRDHRGRGEHRHRAHACLRPDRDLWPRVGVRQACGVERDADRPARRTQRTSGRARADAGGADGAGSRDDGAGAVGRRDDGRDHVPRQHHHEGVSDRIPRQRMPRSPAAGSTPAISR